MNKKTKKIIEDSERDNIPIFIFIAKDILSLDSLRDYYADCDEFSVSDEHCKGVSDRIKEFELWQKNNPDKVKLPD
jgi:hypothetical protein